jgi:glycosyltransferase involved in cell wall biosynthesis
MNAKDKKNIIISSTQYPGYGGAATNAYQIIKYLRKNGYNVVGIFFHNDLNVNYNPENIDGIFLYKFNNYTNDKVINDVKSYLKNEPNYCIAKNYVAPYLCKKIFNIYTVYLVSGINHFNYYTKTSAIEFLKDSFKVNKEIKEEILTNEICDSIIVNSNLSYDCFKKIYPQFINKLKEPLDTTCCVKKLNKKYDKVFDIILICSNFKRESKNNTFLINILKNKIFEKYKKLIIGNNNKDLDMIPNSSLLPLQNHEKCLEYMSKSKILLYPSLYESNSNTIREAYYHGCLSIITRNVGYHELFPEYLICNDFSNLEWINKINYVLNEYNNIKNVCINFNKTFDINKLLE